MIVVVASPYYWDTGDSGGCLGGMVAHAASSGLTKFNELSRGKAAMEARPRRGRVSGRVVIRLEVGCADLPPAFKPKETPPDPARRSTTNTICSMRNNASGEVSLRILGIDVLERRFSNII
jgi:hypothetical protein